MTGRPAAGPVVGERVRVYRNLHHGTGPVHRWSIVGRRKGKDGITRDKVVAVLAHVELDDVELRVQEGGRQRAIREGKRNVHAYAVGTLRAFGGAQAARAAHLDRFSYNPWKGATFYTCSDSSPVDGSSFARFDVDGAWMA